jgi:DNA-binding MarR family transcriptional regulator
MNTNSLARLIDVWNTYSSKNTSDSLEDFAAWLLAKELDARDAGGETDELKFKLIELTRILELQARRVFEGDALDLETLRILSIVEKLKNPKKQDVVISSLMETSTGFYILKLLVKRKLLKQEVDQNDKRSFLISLTAYGKIFLNNKRKALQKVLLLQGVSSISEKKVFTKTLNAIHAFHKIKIHTDHN